MKERFLYASDYVVDLVRCMNARVSDQNVIRRASINSQVITEIDKIFVRAAKCLGIFNPVHAIGFDIGIDNNERVWIIEANFGPNFGEFRKLNDKSIYNKIQTYRKENMEKSKSR